MNQGALHGLRVIGLTNDSGRFATKVLTELGASVLRISAAGSSGAPMADPAAAELGGVLDWWYDGGKSRHTVDLDTDEGRQLYRDSAASADLVIETEAMDCVRDFVKNYDAMNLWWEAQNRHVAFGGVHDIAAVAAIPSSNTEASLPPRPPARAKFPCRIAWSR